jgi:transcriptional regulator with XRE-family HTH domain
VPKQNVDQEICRAVARALKAERLKQGLSLNVLATRAGLSYQIISYIERDMRIPKLDTLARLALALGIKLSDLLRRAERE